MKSVWDKDEMRRRYANSESARIHAQLPRHTCPTCGNVSTPLHGRSVRCGKCGTLSPRGKKP